MKLEEKIMNDISIIILNYNSSEYTIKCIESIRRITNKSLKYEIIVVDNNSTTPEFNKMSYLQNFENIKILKSKINLGFSGGNTFGFQFTNSKYIYFLNNDCELINDNLYILYTFMEENNSVGLCSGQMYSADLKIMKTINYLPTISLKLFGNSTLRFINKDKYPNYKMEFDKPLKVESLAGASLFFRTKAFCKIGGFDLNYFLFCEEEEIGFKLKKNAIETYLVPEAKFIHYLSKSTNPSYKTEREFYISLMYYFRKNYKYPIYLGLKILYFFKLLRKFYKNIKYLKLSLFILLENGMVKSIRHEQSINCGSENGRN